MKRFMKHFITTSLCLVLALVALVGCKENLGSEIKSDAEVQAAQTAITTAVGDTMAYEEGYSVNATVSMKGDMGIFGAGVNTDIRMDATCVRTGSDENAKVRTTQNLSAVLSSKGSKTTVETNVDTYLAKVGDNYVAFDVNSQNKYIFTDSAYKTAQEDFIVNIPDLDDIIGNFDGNTGLQSFLTSLDFSKLDADIFTLYKVNDTTFNLVIRSESVSDNSKMTSEMIIAIKDGKISKLKAGLVSYENTNLEATSEEEMNWKQVGEIKAEITIKYGSFSVNIPSVDLEKYNKVSDIDDLTPSVI